MKYFSIIILFLLILNSVCIINTFAEEITVSAKSAVVIDSVTGRILYEKNCREKRPMASTTKIMTGLVALEEGNLSDIVTISPKASHVEGSSIWLEEGEKMKLEDLIYGLLLSSGNDAAVAIAEHVGGSVKEFADMMNKKAREIGAVDSSFKNPNGLDEEGHFTTAYDLALITRAALKNEKFAEIVKTKRVKIPWEGHKWDRVLKNHNKLLDMYENCDGVKTGYTKKSGRCLVSSATKNNWQVIAVTLNAPNDWEDHKKMLDYAFNNYKLKILCNSNEYMKSIPVIDGKEKDKVPVITNNSAQVYMKEDEIDKVKMKMFVPDYLEAPVDFNKDVGKIEFYLDDILVGESGLITNDYVEAKDYEFIFKLIIKNWLDFNNFSLNSLEYIM